MTEVGWKQKERRRENALAAVLYEQHYQSECGESDPELIAQLYAQETIVSKERAQRLALEDEQEVRNYMQELTNQRSFLTERRPVYYPSPAEPKMAVEAEDFQKAQRRLSLEAPKSPSKSKQRSRRQ